MVHRIPQLAALLAFTLAVRATEPISVVHDTNASLWRITGQRHQVALDPATLAMTVRTPDATWKFTPPRPEALRVRSGGKTPSLALTAAGTRNIAPYANGFETGLQIELREFRAPELPDLALQLRLCLETGEEDLTAVLIIRSDSNVVQRCDWPPGLAPESFDATVVPFMQGMLLPKDWPRRTYLYDQLSFGRGLYQPWWGYQQGRAAMLTLLETPDDGGCTFEHPAGGPTRLGVQWASSLGRWESARRARYCFIEQGNYVQLAKRYRRHALETGRFVSLKEKMTRNPPVKKLIGAPVVHTSILYHIQPESSYYKTNDPAHNHQLTPFATRSREFRALAARGYTNVYVHLDGWGLRGYDNLHPDVLPPAPEAGGWAGMKELSETCAELGYIFAIHDQYRDYYLDAASYQDRHTVLEANGQRPLHGTWYGGRQSILCPSLALGHVRKNHRGLIEGGVRLRGAYLDVFSVVPPDECYHPEHRVTRTDCLRFRGKCLDFVRSYGGVVSSEEPSDWSVPHLDLVHHGPFALDPNPGKGPAMGVPVPLFNLVYHDALLMPWSLERGAWGIPEKDLGFLHGLANGGMPYLGLNPGSEEASRVRAMMALHRRVALLEMVNHEFLEGSWRRQRTTYADGTQVTIDLEKDAWSVEPALE